MDSNLPKVSVVALRHPKWPNMFLHGLRADNKKWALPGGHAMEGEVAHETANRELQEETGLEGVKLDNVREDKLGEGKDRIHIQLFMGICPNDANLDPKQDPDSEFVTYKFIDPSNHDNMHIPEDRNILLHHLGAKLHKTITFKDESEVIKENKKKPEAHKPHKFKEATWTHPNGHPRCFICGDEERIDGECEGITPENFGKSDPTNIPNHFSMISAQHSEVHNAGAHEKLRQDLIHHGYKPQEVTGHYGYPEKSFMVPHSGSDVDKKSIEVLGSKYKQESVLHSSHLNNKLVNLRDPSQSRVGTGHSKDFSDNMFTELPGGYKMKLHLGKSEGWLYHYSRSSHPITEIDPARHGSGTPGAESKRGPVIPRSYYYDTQTDHEPDVKSSASRLYRVKHPGKVIDLASPEAAPLKEKAKNQYGILDHNALEQHIMAAGYHGYKNSASQLPNAVALFHKQKVHSEEPIAKKVLDPSLGVTFQVHPFGDTGGKRWPQEHQKVFGKFDPKRHDVRITAHAPNGEQIGTTDVYHEGGVIKPANIDVNQKWRRQGIGSKLYELAEQHTGKKIRPSPDQTKHATKFWAQPKRNFGKIEEKFMEELSKVADDYKQRAMTSTTLLHPVSFSKHNDLPGGMAPHLTVKIFQEGTPAHLPDIDEKLKPFHEGLKKPIDMNNVKIIPYTIENKKFNRKTNVLLINGLPDHLSKIYEATRGIGTTHPSFLPHVTVSDELWQKVKDGNLTPKDLGMVIHPAELRYGNETIKKYT